MSRETRRLVGKKLPMLGTPLVMVGITHNTEKHFLDVEIHVFFEGIYKAYTPRPFEWAYGDENTETCHAITNQWINDEIEQIIVDKMEENKIPIEFYRNAVAEEPDKFFMSLEKPEFFKYVLGLWARGRYDEEVKHLAYNSNCFKDEFSQAMKFPQMKLRVTRA